ncbi:uncharacterized protein IUM83_06757 [Phytophthora cinnamomi]|uniref:uncharacterized protein n=1 Tax=Phytophthora cinnamomi TaxID=4785 RepID=UPI00355A62CF|nr:hypothetical protein IUM83_06757 [Phytophthora cinnamomi]
MLEARLNVALADNQAEQLRLREEYQKLQVANAQMSETQQRAQIEQRRQLEALAKLAEQRAAEEAERRKADEARAQYLLGVQKELQEAEARARQAELQKAHEDRASKIRAEYEVELLKLKEKHAQAEHKRAIDEQEEKIQRFQMAQEQLNTHANSNARVTGSALPSAQTRVSAGTPSN